MSAKLPIWEPSEEYKRNTNLTRFMDFVNKRHGQNFDSYDDLYNWSINSIPDFWASLWEFADIKASKPYDTVVTDLDKMPGARWFPGARFNFAENLLRYRDDNTALIFKSEAQEAIKLTYAQLYDQVARLAKSLRESGVTVGDRVAGYVPNMIESVAAMLATVSIGAIWSSCSPDFGIKGVLDRFRQVEPKVLFTANGYSYKGTPYNSLERVSSFLEDIPSIQRVVVIPYTERKPDISNIPNSIHYEDFIAKDTGLEIQFEQLPFDHPPYIMYSSGTTGVPKCVIHKAGGQLTQHIKELMLHCDLKREDTIFYFTTCGWGMWNWLVSSLSLGATVLLFDGSPFYPDPGALLKLAQDEKISVFGISPRYLAELERVGVKPVKEYDLSSLKTILCTGSPLSVENYRFVYRDIKKDVFLNNFSGGTEIISCFGIGNPISPIYEGEMQGFGLGMKVEVFDPQGNPVVGQEGELVCTAPFPSMPVGFWNDENNQRYKSTYFEVYPNVWHHGDYAEITDTGGLVIHGRSDATLNPGGVRMGTAEIYRQVEAFDEIQDSIVVGQNWEDDMRVILFVKLARGVELSEDLINKIKATIRSNVTPRHVPAKVIAVGDIPYTISGKKVELAVKNVIHNRPVLNKDALANPEALDFYQNLAELQS